MCLSIASMNLSINTYVSVCCKCAPVYSQVCACILQVCTWSTSLRLSVASERLSINKSAPVFFKCAPVQQVCDCLLQVCVCLLKSMRLAFIKSAPVYNKCASVILTSLILYINKSVPAVVNKYVPSYLSVQCTCLPVACLPFCILLFSIPLLISLLLLSDTVDSFRCVEDQFKTQLQWSIFSLLCTASHVYL